MTREKTFQEAAEQFFGGNCIENKNTAVQTGEMTSSDNLNLSTESQTSTQNNAIMAENRNSANASQVEAAEQFLGGGNCGKVNATPNAEGTGSAVVKTYIKKGGDNVG